MSPPPPETFRSHLPALAGSVTGTLIAAVIGSYLFGKEGTKYALIIGSTLSGTASWWIERAIRRSQAIAAAKLKAREEKGQSLNLEETQRIEAIHGKAFDWRWRGIHYRTIFLLVLTAFCVAFLTVFGLDQLGARPASYNNRPVQTPTVIRTSYVPVPVVTTEPVYLPSSSSPSFTPKVSKSAEPSPSETTTTPSPGPDLTPSNTNTTGVTPSPLNK